MKWASPAEGAALVMLYGYQEVEGKSKEDGI